MNIENVNKVVKLKYWCYFVKLFKLTTYMIFDLCFLVNLERLKQYLDIIVNVYDDVIELV